MQQISALLVSDLLADCSEAVKQAGQAVCHAIGRYNFRTISVLLQYYYDTVTTTISSPAERTFPTTAARSDSCAFMSTTARPRHAGRLHQYQEIPQYHLACATGSAAVEKTNIFSAIRASKCRVTWVRYARSALWTTKRLARRLHGASVGLPHVHAVTRTGCAFWLRVLNRTFAMRTLFCERVW